MRATRTITRQLTIKIASLLLLIFTFPSISFAVPSFARQTGFDCTVCHTNFPQLTEFGRQFKMNGYTMSDGKNTYVPLAMMLTPSFTHTNKNQEPNAAPGFNENNNFVVGETSLFYAGRLFGPYAESIFGKDGAEFANKIGMFLQTTYSGVDHDASWDNWDLRYSDTTKIGERDSSYGFYVNNNPTEQDPWNTVPAWSFPFMTSDLAPAPAAAPLIADGLGQQVVGAGGYMNVYHGVYLDLAGYQNLSARTQTRLGVDPTDETQLSNTAPYWRLATEQDIFGGDWEFGTYGLSADTYPGRNQSQGSDHTLDLALDTQYQTTVGLESITARGNYIHEKNNWDASQALGEASNSSDDLNTFSASISDLHDQTYGLNAQYFVMNGDKDALHYADSANGSPDSSGWVLEADYLPFNKNGGPAFWPKSNVKFSVQYVMYDKFDGASNNYDGSGRDASDNNTLFLQSWIVF